MWLRQSTASQEILLGAFLDSTDGNTAETALTIANTDIKLWKEGGTTEASKASGGATHIASGRYYAVLDATDTNTLGKLEINVHVAGALAVRREFMVLPTNVYDALVLGTGYLDVSAVQLAGQAITAAAGVTFPASVASPTNITAGVITTVTNLTNLPSITAGWLTASGIAAAALNGKGDWNIGKTGFSLTQTFPSNFSALSITAGGLVDITQTAADKAWSTAARVLTAGTNIALAKGTGITGFNDLDAAGVAAATWNAATVTYGAAGSYGLLIETNLDAAVSTVGGGSLTAAGIADAVWDEVLSGHLTAGSTGYSLNGAGAAGDPWTTALPGAYGAGTAGKIIGDNINATLSSRATQTSVDIVDNLVDTEVAAIKTVVDAVKVKTDYLPSATAGAAGGVIIAGSNAATTVNITGNITGNLSGSAGSVTGAVGSVTGNVGGNVAGSVGSVTAGVTLAASAVQAIWDAAVVALTTVGSIGKRIVDYLTGDSYVRLGAPAGASHAADNAAIKAETASIQTDTNDIQARLPAALVGGRMDGNLSAISGSTTTMAAFNRALKGNVIGTVGVGSTTTSVVSSSLTPAGSVATQFKGRIMTFADDTTTAALRGQATDITASSASATPTFTVTALTTSPASTDTFSII